MRSAACLLLAVLFAPSVGSARITLVDTPPFQMSMGGYLRTFTAYQKPARDILPVPLPEEISLHAQVTRLELKMSAVDRIALEVHSRFFWLIANEAVGASGATGVGVSAAPRRTVDLSSLLIDGERHRLEHDIDRLALRFFLGPVDLVLGRQAVTWGTANLFPVADLWATFSPFDLDTSQKRGVDALRVTWGVNDTVELDLIVADRGSVEDLSGGVRATVYLDSVDIYTAFAKSYEELALAVGITGSLSTVKLRAEALSLFDLDADAFLLPRITLGVDWFQSADFLLGVEAHFNGAGAEQDDLAGYLAHAAQSRPLARGESYLLGRWYAGLYTTYKPHELVALTLSTVVNLGDPTALLAWSLSYQLAQDVDFSIGGFHGLGDRLELGAYGQQVYLQLAAFF